MNLAVVLRRRFRRLARQRFIAAALRHETAALRREFGDCCFISLGNHCYVAAMLKSWGLKQVSLPFDWVFSTNAMIRHCVEDDFATFLDPQYFQPVRTAVGSRDKRCDHAWYRDHYGVMQVFNHRDPTIPEDFDYYGRCVERFRALMRAKRGAVFLLTFWDRAQARDDFFALERALRDRNECCFLVGAAINTADRNTPTCVVQAKGERSTLLTMTSRSFMRDLNFDAREDDVLLQRSLCNALIDLRRRDTPAGN